MGSKLHASDPVAAAMEELAAQIRECVRCPLHRTRTRAVPGEGNIHAVAMLVGEAPGHEEDRQGRPFVGASGRYLTEALARVGIRREELYITNVVKCRPPRNRDPLPQELEACGGYLDRQIELVNPRIIVTLGRYSMQRFFPGQRITQVHGRIRNIGRGRVAMAMFHPAAALRNPVWKEQFEADLQKLPPLIARGERLPAGVPHPGDPDYMDDSGEPDPP